MIAAPLLAILVVLLAAVFAALLAAMAIALLVDTLRRLIDAFHEWRRGRRDYP